MRSAVEIDIRINILLGIFLCSLLTAGCGQPIKNSWGNFRAYYNTYYNAEKNYQAGLEKVRDQPVTLDPAKPIRIHPSPIQAGKADFEQAIEKAAKIIRKFPDSKWTDDALFLIGKSYYYQQEFFAALQKFEELRNASESAEMERQAIIWKGRTLLELENYSEGISFLENELVQYPNDWPDGKKAEIRIIFAQHQVMLEHWQEAESAFLTALPDIENNKLLGRTYFLYGQVLERLGRYGEAYIAFSRVSKNFVDFEFGYWGEMKRADVARKNDKLDLALSIYKKLRADDKNVDRISTINYEIARTLEMKGNVTEAERRYKDLLYKSSTRNIGSISGKIYFRLGIINSEYHHNFRRAAAYFDTSSSVSNKPNINSNTPDAQTMADAFGQYVGLKNRIARADSLLHLGSLTALQLDSAIADIRRKKRQALLEQQESKSNRKLANRELANDNNQQLASGEYGFLNYRSAQFVQRGISEFRVRWGNRPLVDNWRRIEVVRQSASGEEEIVAKKTRKNITADSLAVDFSLDDIPRNEQAKTALHKEKANARYELGNLFFFTLNMPDSARSYFRKVTNSSPSKSLRARAMYSLYESYNTQENTESLNYWKDRILKQYPNSEYAHAIRNKGSEINEAFAEDSNSVLRKKYQHIVSSEHYSTPTALRKLALANRSSALAPHIYYEAIERYIHRAKNEEALADSTGIFTAVIANSDNSAKKSFESSAWDSVRFALGQFDTTFTNASQQKKVAAMRSFLEEQRKAGDITTCKEQGISLTILPDKETFLSTVDYPQKLERKSISGEVVYRFTLSSDGSIESYTLESTRTSLGIEEAFEDAFDESLRFGSLPDTVTADRIRCTIRFPIRQ
ncbi:Tetratricopeptide repeat-containing protein [Fodinibius salinus]|uniref:Tetratricopeptide repeat-containing protein n=1 Tax=Fodinibius salinus TaxID=860790 RepID=A0A5D3YGG2_9BACT|nr:tetratricopeptide repeat protein [Fodinibius salinus]TYP92773.1 Tetratricopeptide repeat-containing protein [Fodinibius salinus]